MHGREDGCHGTLARNRFANRRNGVSRRESFSRYVVAKIDKKLILDAVNESLGLAFRLFK